MHEDSEYSNLYLILPSLKALKPVENNRSSGKSHALSLVLQYIHQLIFLDLRKQKDPEKSSVYFFEFSLISLPSFQLYFRPDKKSILLLVPPTLTKNDQW